VQASARRAAEEGPSQRQSGSERSHPTWEAWERQRRAHAEWEQQRQAAEKQAREREAAAAQERARRAAAQAREEEERRRQRASVRSLEELHQLSGSDFELLIARHFQRDGYTIERKGGSGDEGVDLIIRLNGTIDVVQCKRWRYDVGAPVVREFYGALMHHGARHGFVITTASITDSARAFAVGKPITLIDGVALLAWLQRGGQPGEARSERGAPSGSASRSPGDQGRAPFDPYRVLGIRRGASQGDIKRAYHTQLQQHHPDKAAHLGREAQALAEARTRDIIEAYRLLRRHAA
jgi:DnaJ-domain-containing protein 1